MALANCKRCGNLFNRVTRDICDACYKREEEDLVKVQHYLRDNAKAGLSIEEVAEANEVDEEMIRKWIRDKRLILKGSLAGAGVDDLDACEACGAPIVGGRLCISCRQQLGPSRSEVEESSKEPAKRDRDWRERGGGGGSQIVKHRR
jgi:hypothetical protein